MGVKGAGRALSLLSLQARALIRQNGTPQLQEPRRLSALLRDCLECSLEPDEERRWAAQELLQLRARGCRGSSSAREGFSCGAPSDSLQSGCVPHAEQAESSPAVAWQAPLELIWAWCPTASRDIFKQLRGPRALPDLSLDVSREEAPPTSLGTFCQCFPTLLVKKFFLRSNLSLLPSPEFQSISLCPVATEPVRNLTLESNSSFLSFLSFGQHPFLSSAKPLSSLTPLITAAKQLREQRRR